MKLHFGFTILLNSPNEFVCDHMPVADARATRASESRDRELVGATNPVSGVDLWMRRSDRIRRGAGRGVIPPRPVVAVEISQLIPGVNIRQTAHATPRPDRRIAGRRASREISRSIFMGLAIRNPYPNLIVECPFTCQRLVGGPR